MDLTKKSMKWLVAVFVVFAMILTAVFAAGHVATASANENEQDATVHLWVTDSAALGTYPDLIRSAAQRTITVDYGFEIAEESEFSIFAISPVLIYEDDDPVKPTAITLNPAFSEIAALENVAANENGYLSTANNAATAFYVDLTDGEATSTDLNAYVNDEWDSTKYLFRATYVISANAYGVYELSFGANTAFALESGSYYLPEIENGDFAIRAPIGIPVAVTGLTYNTTLQTGVTDANGNSLYNDQDAWISPDFSLVNNTVVKGTFAGGYSAEFALADPVNTCWADNTTTNQTVNWSIAVLSVEKPSPASVSVTYNGEEQSYPASQNTYYTYSGSGTNVGDYDVTVALDNDTHGNSLIWVSVDPESPDTASFDVEDAFSITPAAVTLSFNDNNEGYTSAFGSALANIEVSASGLFGNDSLGTLGYSVVDNQNAAVANFGSTTPIGTYTLTTTYTTPNANYTVTTDTADYVITKKQVTKPTEVTTAFVYSGSEQTYTLATSSDYTITGTTAKTDAGSNDITIALNDKANTEWATNDGTTDIVYTFTIAPKAVTLSFNDNNEGYTSAFGSALANIEVSASGLIGANDLGTLSYSAKDGNNDPVTLSSATPIGTYTLTTTYTANANYAVTPDTANYVITKKQVAKPAEDSTVFTYNGSVQTYTLATSSDYTITGDTTKTNAGSNDITIALVDKTNTEWTTGGTADVVYTFTIAKKAVTLDFYDSDDVEPWHLTFVATYPDSLYYITVKATGLIGANDLGELGFTATNDETHAVADITVEGAPAGYYTLTPTYTIENTNYQVTALQGSARIYVLNAPVPVVVTDTYNYDGTAKAIVFDNASTDGYSQYYTITGNSLTEPGTTTVTVALKNEYAGNVIWGYDERVDEFIDTTDDQTFTLTVNAVNVNVKFSVTTSAGNTVYYYNYENEALVATTENEWVAASIDVRDALPAYPTYSFFHTAGWKSGNNVVTALTPAMSGETLTLNAHFIYNVGAGDVDGNGIVNTLDLIKMKRYYIGLETEVLEDATAAWAAAIADTAEAPVFVSALDANGSGAFRINDLVTIREALATGYDFKIVIGRQGVTGQSIENVEVLTVYEYDEFVAAVKTGIPVKLGANITAEDERFDETIDIPVDIDLNGKALTVEYFGLNSAAYDLTFSIKGGTIYAFDDIVITAPNGNVKLDNVTGYNYVTDEVILAAASSSLHFDNVVEFLKYPEDSEMFASKIAALLAALQGDDAEAQADAIAAVNEDVAPASVSIPVDTHVVVEEAASLVVEKITVVEASNDQANVTTFSINVKSTTTETVTVDVTSKVENDYVVEAVNQAGTIAKIEIVTDTENNQDISTNTGVKNEAELRAALTAGQDYIVLLNDICLTDTVSVKNLKTVLDMNGKKLYNTTDIWNKTANGQWALVDVRNDGDLTITGNGTFDALENDIYAVCVRGNNSKLVIENGTFIGNHHAVYVYKGDVVIYDGDYSIRQPSSNPDPYGYVINLNDQLRDDCSALIYGGTYHKFNPSDCPAEGAHTNFLADGYFVTEANDIYTVTAPTGVARIGTVGYATLVDAINALEDGDTIVLLEDIDFADAAYAEYAWIGNTYHVIEIGKNNVTIDLNNHTIRNMGNNALTAGHYYAADGRISNFTIKNGTLIGRTETTAYGDLVISYALQIAGVDNALVKNVTTIGGVNMNSGTTNMVIEDCDITGTRYYAVDAQKGGDVTIKNTVINKLYNISNYSTALIWVDNSSKHDAMKTATNPEGTFGTTTLTIESGSVTVDPGFTLKYGAAPIIKGGTFNVDPTAYVPAGYGITEEGGIYTVAPLTGAAYIGHTAYNTFDAAVAAAQNGDTIVLLADVTYGTDHNAAVWGKTFNLDLNGHTYTSNSTVAGWRPSAIVYEFTGGSVTVSNGTVVSANGSGIYSATNSVVTLENLTVTGGTNNGAVAGDAEYCAAIRITEQGTVTVNSGTYTGTYALVVSNSGGTMIVNGGTFNGKIYFASNTDPGVTKTITINGGTFTNVAFENTNKGTLTIKGGTFDADPTEFVAEGYGANKNGEEWTVVAKTYVGSQSEMDAARAAQAKYIALSDDFTITVSQNYPIMHSTTIDLNGHKLTINGIGLLFYAATSHECTILDSVGGGVLEGTGNYAVYMYQGVTLNVKSGTIRCAETPICVSNGNLNITGGDLIATGSTGIDVFGNAAHVINISGGTITAHEAGIYVNGDSKYTATVEINISGGTINAKGGIYQAGLANTTVSGTASINGTDYGIEVRAGSLTVTGGSITAEAAEVSVTPNGNGSTTIGAAIAVAQHTTKRNITVSVTGGTITGANAIHEENPQGNSDADLAKISITIGVDATLVGDVVITDEAKITYTNNQNA